MHTLNIPKSKNGDKAIFRSFNWQCPVTVCSWPVYELKYYFSICFNVDYYYDDDIRTVAIFLPFFYFNFESVYEFVSYSLSFSASLHYHLLECYLLNIVISLSSPDQTIRLSVETELVLRSQNCKSTVHNTVQTSWILQHYFSINMGVLQLWFIMVAFVLFFLTFIFPSFNVTNSNREQIHFGHAGMSATKFTGYYDGFSASGYSAIFHSKM